MAQCVARYRRGVIQPTDARGSLGRADRQAAQAHAQQEPILPRRHAVQQEDWRACA